MATKNDDRVYDELLCFLGDPIFQIPVRTFMDENSLIFDPSIQIGEDHCNVHGQYKKLIDNLLEGFCQDAKITTDEAIAGISKMSQVPDLKEVFQVLFEQVSAATNFNVFCQVMIKRNIMIQEQVLVMIIAATGQVPASFESAASKKTLDAKEPKLKGAQDNEEENVLRKIMQQSKDEQRKVDVLVQREEAELKHTIELSMKEAQSLEHSRKAMEQAMEQMVLTPQTAPIVSPKVIPTTSKATPNKQSTPSTSVPSAAKSKPPVAKQTNSDVSSSQAANQWLEAAQTEAAGSSAAHSVIAASLSQLSPDELKKRQEYLSQQRDKLLAMKKETREKQLGIATKSQPQRPLSARAARSAMNSKEDASSSVEDQRKIAMRKAIAEKLRQEVLDVLISD